MLCRTGWVGLVVFFFLSALLKDFSLLYPQSTNPFNSDSTAYSYQGSCVKVSLHTSGY